MHDYDLTQDQALYVKKLRIQEDYSWRSVAARFDERYPYFQDKNGRTVKHGNQLDGRDLCYSAMKFLEEEVDDGWN